MGEWQDTILSDVIELIGGGTPKTAVSKYWNGDIPWLSVADFNTGKKYVQNTEKYITKLGFENSSTSLLNKGDIIISARGTVGVVSMLGSPMAFNQSCYGVRAKDSTFNEYVYYLLKDAVNKLLQISHGGVFDTITRDTFKEIVILLPPLREQKAIAKVLSSLDDKIDLLHRQNKTLEALAETLFRQWFVEEASEEWGEKTLEEIADIGIGRTPPRKESQWFSKVDIDVFKWVSIKSLAEQGVYIFHTEEFLTMEAVKKFRIPVIPKDTVLLSFKMTVGRVGITSTEMLSNEAIAHFKIKNEDVVCKEFLYLFLKHFKYDLLGSTSSIVTAINSSMIRKLRIWLPSKKERMVRFKSQVIPLFEKIRRNQIQIYNLATLRDTLLPKLMGGEIRVQ